jgi:glutamate/aspartate transport system substrate-binding protein
MITLSLFALASFGAAAQDGTLAKIKSSGAITIGHRDASVPLSYYDDKQQPIGYAMDLCMKIVDAVKAELKMPAIKVNYQLVTSANRIPLMANGTIDLECGSTTNNIRARSRSGSR